MADRQNDLLRLIYEEPHVDEHKRIYAEWLLSQGNPRGELIMLQLRREAEGLGRADAARERALLDQYGEYWLGPLAWVIEPGSAVFRKGFLSECALRPIAVPDKRPERFLELPIWATVEKLGGALWILDSPWLRSLWSLGPTSLDTLATCPLPQVARIRELRIRLPPVANAFDLATAKGAARAKAFTQQLLVRDGKEYGQGNGRCLWVNGNALGYVQLASRFPHLRSLAICHPEQFIDAGQDPADEILSFIPYFCGSVFQEVERWKQNQGVQVDMVTVQRRVSMTSRAWQAWDIPRPDLRAWLNIYGIIKMPRIVRLEPYHGWSFTLEHFEHDKAWTLHLDWNLLAASSDIRVVEMAVAWLLHDQRTPSFQHITVSVTGYARPQLRQALSTLLAPLGPVEFLD